MASSTSHTVLFNVLYFLKTFTKFSIFAFFFINRLYIFGTNRLNIRENQSRGWIHEENKMPTKSCDTVTLKYAFRTLLEKERKLTAKEENLRRKQVQYDLDFFLPQVSWRKLHVQYIVVRKERPELFLAYNISWLLSVCR